MADKTIQLTEGTSTSLPTGKNGWSNWTTRPAPLLEADAEVFLHQSLSTPCLDVLADCEGSVIRDVEGSEFLDFHGNSVHQVGLFPS